MRTSALGRLMALDVTPLDAIARSLALALAVAVTTAVADEKLYRVNSKDVGWGAIDLTISETERKERISVLRVPHYEDRSAVESRFAMCAFTDLAMRRDFQIWIVPATSGIKDMVRVGFLKSDSEDAAKLLGRDYVGENVLRVDVAVMNRMCGIQRTK